MILLSPNAINALKAEKVDYFYLLAIRDSSNSILYAETTLSHDISMEGVDYQAHDRVIYIDPPTVATLVDRGQFKVVFDDSNDDMNSTYLGETLVGKQLEVHISFFNPDGLPYTSISDALLLYRGPIDTFVKEIDNSELGSNVLTITAGSPLINLDDKRFIYVSKDFIRARNPKDSCADFVRTSSSNVSLRWGKL
jgi:hypothetical protein